MSSVCTLLTSEDRDVMDAPADETSSPSPTSDCLPSDHPLNLTKRRDPTLTPATALEEHSAPSQGVSGPVACRVTAPADCTPASKSRPSSFSLKTSPSKFLGSPADKRRGWSRAPRRIGGWSELGGGAAGILQPAYDNDAASIMLSTSSSVLDRVSVQSYPFLINKFL